MLLQMKSKSFLVGLGAQNENLSEEVNILQHGNKNTKSHGNIKRQQKIETTEGRRWLKKGPKSRMNYSHWLNLAFIKDKLRANRPTNPKQSMILWSKPQRRNEGNHRFGAFQFHTIEAKQKQPVVWITLVILLAIPIESV